MITKVSTHTKPELIDFDLVDSPEYWDSLCRICYNRECTEDHLILPGEWADCEDCDGTGRIRFGIQPQGKPYYECITLCGQCEGLGLV